MVQIEDRDYIRVVEFIAEKGWIRKGPKEWTTPGWFVRKPVTWNTRIETDLGCAGDDMEELMGPFFEKFSVSPQGFVPKRYFHGESFGPRFICAFLYYIINRRPYPPCPTYDLTIEDLVRCVRARKWVDPPSAPEWREPENTFGEFIQSLR